MFRCGPIGSKVYIVSVITEVNYRLNTTIFENDRKRAKSFSLSFPIIFTVIVFVFSITVSV
jgi:hypothetical protein